MGLETKNNPADFGVTGTLTCIQKFFYTDAYCQHCVVLCCLSSFCIWTLLHTA